MIAQTSSFDIRIVIDCVVVAAEAILVSSWVNWSQGVMKGKRLAFLARTKRHRHLGIFTFVCWIAALADTSRFPAGHRFRGLSAVVLVVLAVAAIASLLFWILSRLPKIGTLSPNQGDGLEVGDFELLSARVKGVRTRIDWMLIGGSALSWIGWGIHTNSVIGNGWSMRVISICREGSLGMLSLGIVGFLSVLSDALVLRSAGITSQPYKGPWPKMMNRFFTFLTTRGPIAGAVLLGLWSLWSYLKSPLGSLGVLVLSIPLGLVWELTGKNDAVEIASLNERISKILRGSA